MASALQLFSLKGWSGFTIEETAKRALLGKATVYLRWRDREELLIDALRWADQKWPIACSGSAEGDLFNALVTMIRRFALPQGWALHCSLLDPALPRRVRAYTRTIAESRLLVISELLANANEMLKPDPLRATMLVGAAMSFAGVRALTGTYRQRTAVEDYARKVIAFHSRSQ